MFLYIYLTSVVDWFFTLYTVLDPSFSTSPSSGFDLLNPCLSLIQGFIVFFSEVYGVTQKYARLRFTIRARRPSIPLHDSFWWSDGGSGRLD